jgi:hypothetical protein
LARFALRFPRKKQTRPEWQAAVRAIMLAVDLDRPTVFARIGISFIGTTPRI